MAKNITEIELPNEDGTQSDIYFIRDQYAYNHAKDGKSPSFGGEAGSNMYKFAVSSEGHVGNLTRVQQQDIGDLGFYTKEEADELFSKSGLPEIVPEEDEGKVLQVVDGEWSAAEPPNGLPDVTEEDNGKVLSVIEGTWAATDNKDIVEITKEEYDALGDEKLTDNKLYFIKDYTESYAMNGKGMISKVLWEGEAGKDQTVTLNDHIINYDLLIFTFGVTRTLVEIPANYSSIGRIGASLFANTAYYSMFYGYFNSDNIFYIENLEQKGYNWCVTKIVGLKFCAATACYSTEEQIVGRWIDGKPVYQKTYVVDIPTRVTQVVIDNFTLSNYQLCNSDVCIAIGGVYDGRQYAGSSPEGGLSIIPSMYDNLSLLVKTYNSDAGWAYPMNVIATIQYTKTTD